MMTVLQESGTLGDGIAATLPHKESGIFSRLMKFE
jgi:hypothetical protein